MDIRATLDIDLLAFAGSGERILQCGRSLGFTLEAAPMQFAGGTVHIKRLSKAMVGNEDVLMLAVLSLAPEIEKEITVKMGDWHGIPLQVVDRLSLVRLKMLRGSMQDRADVEKLI